MNKEQLINKYAHLFWYINKADLHHISNVVLVEFILNYGSLEAVQDVFLALGKENVAKEFVHSLQTKRNNYFPQVKHFFDLYFKKNVPQYPF